MMIFDQFSCRIEDMNLKMKSLFKFRSLSPSKDETKGKLSYYHMAYTYPEKSSETDLDCSSETDMGYISCNENIEVTLYEALKYNAETFNNEPSFIFKNKN
jgi:signal transduction histidine kinase